MTDIELVIKIPKKVYNALRHTEFDANLVVDEMRKAIANGTPLPKGHGRLIDADRFRRDVYLERRYGYDFYREFQSRLKRQLTVVEADKVESEPQESEDK